MTNGKSLSPDVLESVRKSQQDEADGSAVYAYMAAREKNPRNRELLEQMSADEQRHEAVWGAITGEKTKPSAGKLRRVKALTVLLGFTFVMKWLEKGEQLGQIGYDRLKEQLPEAATMYDDEKRHEGELEGMLDEERLHYVGAMVLGLNDALVELTGAIAGVTFSLANTRLVALTGIVTGIAATLSMAASNYLAETADGV